MHMVLLIHIAIAISSILVAFYTLFSPTKSRLQASYALTGLTLASGSYLVITGQSNLLHACISGLAYLTIAYTAIIAAQKKFNFQSVSVSNKD